MGSFIYFSEHFFAVGTIKGKYWMVVLMEVSIGERGEDYNKRGNDSHSSLEKQYNTELL